MKIMLKYIITGFLLVCFFHLKAQEKEIRGVVTTFDSIPLIGVEITIKSTKQVVLTDTLGMFYATVGLKDKLKMKAKGFYPQRVNIKEGTKIVAVNLKLKSGEKARSYAIGYGHVLDKEKLNAVANLNHNDMDFSQYHNLYDVIRGRFAGVQIVNGEIIIRGVNSINSSSAALIVVDGVPVDGGILNTLPPIEVRSISVLKDGASAIYGSRGANGVVIIETKKGTE